MSDGAPSQPTPRIYVASLSDYNAGHLHGVWIDAAGEVEDVQASIKQMLVASRSPDAEEWAIHDYEGFGSLGLGEYEAIEQVCLVARGIAAHGMAFAHYAALLGSGSWDELDQFEERYRGHFASMVAYAGDYWEDLGFALEEVVPDHIKPYVHLDLEALARDLEADLQTSDGDDGVYVFSD